MQNKPDIILSQLLSSRLCHDLIAPMSAVKTGLELLTESENAGDHEVLELVTRSANIANQRLSFFRLVFGYSSIDNVKSLNELYSIIKSYLDPVKYQLSCEFSTEIVIASDSLKFWVRLITNLILICVEITPYGGKLDICFIDSSHLTIQINGQVVKLQLDIKNVLERGCDNKEITVQTIHAYYCYYWLQMLGKKLMIEEDKDNLTLRTV